MVPSDKSPSRRVCFVQNAKKPRDPAERACDALKARGCDVELVVTEHAQDGTAAAQRALDAGADLVVAAGGDGTAQSVLAPVVAAGATLGLIPLGTANDFATHLGVGRGRDATPTLVDGHVLDVDLVRVRYVDVAGVPRESFASSSAGLGVMGRLAELEESPRGVLGKRVLGNGVWPLLAAAATLTVKFARGRVTVDGHTMERDLVALEVLKLPAVGGFELLPDASATSGVLHAWIAEGTTRRELLHTLRRALEGRGRIRQSHHAQHFSRDASSNVLGLADVGRIDIETTPPLPLHVNGDHVGSTPASFVVVPKVLRVLVPAGTASRLGGRA